MNVRTFGRTPWTGDQPDARPLPTQDNTTKKNAETHIHAPIGIRTHNPSVPTAEDSTCLRRRGHWDRLPSRYANLMLSKIKNNRMALGRSVFASVMMTRHVTLCATG
jgi:hypothetical protein